ncbi:delta 1-pyrroline-5-carboxylate reductase [Tilletia horrida]|nr:delta 1-pyrroline-5-carboxylate reductase [Tilletia horrida]
MNRGGFGGRGGGGGGGFRGGGRGGRGGGRGGFGGGASYGPPETVQEIGTFVHAVEGEMLCNSTDPKHVPYFNAPIYLQNKSSIGKVDEILGPINAVSFTIKMDPGLVATSFKPDDKVYIGGDRLLPIERFLPKPKVVGPKPPKKKGGSSRGGARGGGRGGRGAPRGRGGPGRGAPRGAGGFRGGGRGGAAGGRGGFRGGAGGGGGGFGGEGKDKNRPPASQDFPPTTYLILSQLQLSALCYLRAIVRRLLYSIDTMSGYTLAIIACGTMGQAILSGVIEAQHEQAEAAALQREARSRSVSGHVSPNPASPSRPTPLSHPAVSALQAQEGSSSSSAALPSSAVAGGLSASQMTEDDEDGNGASVLPSRYLCTVSRPESVKKLRSALKPASSLLPDPATQLTLLGGGGSNVRAAREADVVLLCCKPNMVKDILAEQGMRDALKGKLVVSICAGLRIAQIEAWVDVEAGTKVVRAMPNTPSKIREGMTVVTPLPPSSTPLDKAILLALFSSVGRCRILEEKHFDACTALAGSGPAFACVFLEAMADGGVMMGLPRAEALELAAQAMQGAARMVLQTSTHPAALKDSVTTPGGCTIAGLLNLEDGKVRSTVARTIQAATEHASGLGQAKKN